MLGQQRKLHGRSRLVEGAAMPQKHVLHEVRLASKEQIVGMFVQLYLATQQSLHIVFAQLHHLLKLVHNHHNPPAAARHLFGNIQDIGYGGSGYFLLREVHAKRRFAHGIKTDSGTQRSDGRKVRGNPFGDGLLFRKGFQVLFGKRLKRINRHPVHIDAIHA